MENQVLEKNKNSKILVTNKSITNLCGVSKVVSATPSMVSVILAGDDFVIEGENLHVTKLDVDAGVLDLEGKVNCFKFTKNKNSKNFFKRIFS